MNRRDDDLDDLDALLAPLRSARPTATELARWEAALHAASRSTPRPRPWLRPLALLAAVFLGLVLGTAVTSTLRPASPCANESQHLAVENNAPPATVERLYSKLD